jgi:NhaA family Na+:H+ antiporter
MTEALPSDGNASVLRRFLDSEAAGGLVLIGAAALALIAANSGLAGAYDRLLHLAPGPVLSPRLGPMSVHLWINDGLMALFFLLVGLEIKRELVAGNLATPAHRRLPLVAAAAGMALPALLYLAIAGTAPDGAPGLARGWAIPAATDIAFALGVLALLGRRAPPSLRIFLATVAVADDLGAVAIIAFFYAGALDLAALAAAGLVFLVMIGLARVRVASLWPYLGCAALLWYAVLLSGIHPTVAGVLAAAAIPAGEDGASPLHRLEHALSPWVAFAIIPLFGFANAGVALDGDAAAAWSSPLPLGIAAGLFLGKQVGIFGAIRLAVGLGVAERPNGASWRQVHGVATLCGIGFTMSLFIGALAFPDRPALVEQAKIGTLAGSFLSALAGYALLRFAPGRPEMADAALSAHRKAGASD